MRGVGELVIILLVLSLVGIWAWALVDCVKHERGVERLLWAIVIVVGAAVGAVLYLVVRRARRPASTDAL